MEKVTSDYLLATVKELVEGGQSISAERWMNLSLQLLQVGEDDTDALIEAEQMVARKKLEILNAQAKRNVAAAEVEVETTPEYARLRKLQEKVKRIEETVRGAKKYATINEFRG